MARARPARYSSAPMADQDSATAAVVRFVVGARFAGFPADAVAIAKRCIIDGLGVLLAGSTQPAGEILRAHVEGTDTRHEATVLGPKPFKTSAANASLVNGTSGHALDWDDTQLATSADRIFGLLTHPTIPPLVATFALGERARVSGQQLLEAFLTGFEVECKIAEAIHPNHYKKGFHTSGTVGTFAAAVAAAKLLGSEPGASRAHARDCRELGVGHSRELRQHDEAAARRPRGAERRRRGGARRARLHGRQGRARSAVGILPDLQPRRRLRPRPHRRRAREPAHDRFAGRFDQTVPVRRARPSDDGRDASTRDRARREAADDQGDSRARGLEHLESAALFACRATSSRRSSVRRSWSARSRCAAKPASASSTTSSCAARRYKR